MTQKTVLVTVTSSLIEPGNMNTPIWDKAGDLISDLTTRLAETGLMERYGFLLAGQNGFVDEGQSKGVSPDAVAQAIEQARIIAGQRRAISSARHQGCRGHETTTSRPSTRGHVGFEPETSRTNKEELA